MATTHVKKRSVNMPTGKMETSVGPYPYADNPKYEVKRHHQETMDFGKETQREYPERVAASRDDIMRATEAIHSTETLDRTQLEALSTKCQELTNQVSRVTGDLYRKTSTIFGEQPTEALERPQLDESMPSLYALETSVELLAITVEDLTIEARRYTESGL